MDGWNTTTRATCAETRGSSWHRKHSKVIEEVVEMEDGVLVNPACDRSAVRIGVDGAVEVGA